MVIQKTKSPWLKDIKIKAIDIVKKDFLGNTPPTIFVGSKHITDKKANLGILSPLDEKESAWKYDAPYHWYENNYTIKRIVELRANLINARKLTNIFDVKTNNKFIDLAQEISMSRKTTTVEVQLKKKLNANLNFDKIHLPFGPSGEINKIWAVDNIKLEPKIEKIFYDTDLKAKDALLLLKDRGIPEYHLSQLLSIGIMGLKYNRKLVPTKWSITATDDTIGKSNIEEIKTYPIFENYRIYLGDYLGNYYLIIMFPNPWSYELFESAMPDKLSKTDDQIYTTTDYENYTGRKDYASNTVGGYYAARLSVLEELKKLKRQSSCLVLRYVTSEYSLPLGVFVVRQAVRKALSNPAFNFEDKKLVLTFAKSIVFRRFGYDANIQFKNSKLLNDINTQTRLSNFF